MSSSRNDWLLVFQFKNRNEKIEEKKRMTEKDEKQDNDQKKKPEVNRLHFNNVQCSLNSDYLSCVITKR